jgi:hypothetical protein
MRTYYEALPWAFANRDDLEEHMNLPFLGFLAGSILSAGIWGVVAGALWAWSKWVV